MEKNEKSILDFRREILKSELTPMGWKVTTLDKLLKANIPPVEFLIENLIPQEAITILSGNPSQGKSWILLEISKCLGSERKLFGKFESKACKVLYVDEESSLSEIQRRFKMLKPPPATLVDFMSLEGFKIDDEEQRKDLIDLVEARGYGLVIFDSLRDIFMGNENDSREAQELIDYFREFTTRGITILISHHQRKDFVLGSTAPTQTLRGSTAILSGIDSLLSIENTKKLPDMIEIVLTHSKLRQGKTCPAFKIALTEKNEKMEFNFIGEIQDEQSKIEKAEQSIKELLRNGEMYQTEIIESLYSASFGQRTIRRAIEELKKNSEVNLRLEGKKVYMRLPV